MSEGFTPSYDELRRWYDQCSERHVEMDDELDSAKSRIVALKAALARAREALEGIEGQSDDVITECDGDGCLCCSIMEEINRRAMEALTPTSAGAAGEG